MADKNRPRAQQLHVPVRPDEKAAIEKLAASTGLPVAAYLRNVGLGYQVHNILDRDCVEELARVNGDLGRLGGLLKLWLTDDPRTAQYGERLIRALLAKIENTQDKMQELMRTVVLPKASR
ncbi:conjugal transfer transcriptional regulator TraJ [Geomonas nitrogeniifigens]|uniref:conjugal transfer transcriptional regulator TraJ n=1 Tax=Geomonas diazotrophica TaxID=2843197 RepID=UPI001C2BDA9E|nr:conjugal transfer transcriptional regulator TraJ [Geomonas nitrogeniifigens]QXE84894.1 conjugal transfer transcriptional regulator TraJ [Geomonas nitrogeniifigens]